MTECAVETVELVNNHGNPQTKAEAYDLMTQGKALNKDTKFNQEAFDLLSRSVELDPDLIDNSIHLAECFQKKGDIEGAISCLENVSQRSKQPNKIVLRKLSIFLRQRVFDSQEHKIAALLRSLELSKQALKLDLDDEDGYYNLAKAYMCLFFVTECVDQQLINLSRSAFAKALNLSNERTIKNLEHETLGDKKDQSISIINSISKLNINGDGQSFINQSDFLFNYSTVLIYFHEFERALEYLKIAIKLDPQWNEPKILEERIVDYLKQITSMLHDIGRNCKRLIKRYNKIVEPLKTVEKIESYIELDQRRLLKSPDLKVESYALSKYESIVCKDKSTKLTESKVIDSHNLISLLNLKLISTINYNQAMYLTFVGIDQEYSLIIVTIYNIAASRCPSAKDVVTIVDPKIRQIEARIPNGEAKALDVSYKMIEVKEFKDFYVNGRRISYDQVSKPQFRVSVLP